MTGTIPAKACARCKLERRFYTLQTWIALLGAHMPTLRSGICSVVHGDVAYLLLHIVFQVCTFTTVCKAKPSIRDNWLKSVRQNLTYAVDRGCFPQFLSLFFEVTYHLHSFARS